MSIVLVRHGQTDGNAQMVLQRPETPLNTLGLRQAELLALRLAGFPVSSIVCSDLARAQMTAAPLALRLGLAVETTPLLAERNFGDLRGTPYTGLASDPFALDFVPPNGESWEAFHARVAQAFALICARRRSLDGDLVVVTHGFVCRALVGRHVPRAAGQELPTRFGNTSVTLLDAEAPHRTQLLNCCAHLAAIGADGPAASGLV